MAVNLMQHSGGGHAPSTCNISQNLTETSSGQSGHDCMFVSSRFETWWPYSVSCIYRNEYRARLGSPFL